MANVHRIGDYEQNQNNYYQQGPTLEQQRLLQQVPMFFNQQESNKEPKDENICDIVKYMCCPSIKWTQFLVIVSVVQIGYFIISLINSDKLSGNFLQVTQQSLISLGAKYAYLERYEWQVYRLFSAMFLHANFLHISYNLVSQLVFGVQLETSVGGYRMCGIYLLSGLGGNLFSSLVSDSIAVGASTAISGILAAYVGYLVVNWNVLQPLSTVRNTMLCMVILLIFINLFMSLGDQSIDIYGHLGGLFVGGLASFILIVPLHQTQAHSKQKTYVTIILVLYFVIGLICFYTLRHPKKLY